jgi:LytR cell envelope-related transcriptional attenuator
LELSRHPVIIALIVLGVLGGTVASVALRPPRPAPAPIKHAYPSPAREHRILVEVLNTTTRPGLARSVTRALRREGLDVIFFGNADGSGKVDSTQVIARRADRGVAQTVAKFLGQGVVKLQTDTLRRVDVTVLLGSDYRPPMDGHP